MARVDVGTGWQGDLQRWLAPFMELLGHKARRRMCPIYVAGLIGPGDRKSIQPMAERLGLGAHDRLHHFVAAGTWDAAPLLEEPARQADALLGSEDAMLVVDDTTLPKKGSASVGVAPQHASALGKQANCQTQVSLALARGEVPVMVGLRLFLPDSWTADPERMRRAGVPAAEAMLAGASWRPLSWRRGTKGRLSARLAALRVRIAHGPTQRISEKGNQHMPGEEAWLIGERRAGGERKFSFSNLPAGTSLHALAGAIKARWICGQAHQQLREELGLDHFDGRSWIGLRRHALMAMIAYAFLQHQRLAMGKGRKSQRRAAA